VDEDTFHDLNEDEKDDDQFFDAAEDAGEAVKLCLIPWDDFDRNDGCIVHLRVYCGILQNA
jgi:hypothetical protein